MNHAQSLSLDPPGTRGPPQAPLTYTGHVAAVLPAPVQWWNQVSARHESPCVANSEAAPILGGGGVSHRGNAR